MASCRVLAPCTNPAGPSVRYCHELWQQAAVQPAQLQDWPPATRKWLHRLALRSLATRLPLR